MLQLILPKTVPLVNYSDPLFFLAGPVLGGDDWQRAASILLAEQFSDCVVVNPCRYEPSHPLYQYRLKGDEDRYESQTFWERYYLREAAELHPCGCLIFWLPEESEINPRSDGNPYAADTRGELGEWRGHLMHKAGLRVVIGAEEGFPGLGVIKKNFLKACGPDFPIYTSLADTIAAAARYASK